MSNFVQLTSLSQSKVTRVLCSAAVVDLVVNCFCTVFVILILVMLHVIVGCVGVAAPLDRL